MIQIPQNPVPELYQASILIAYQLYQYFKNILISVKCLYSNSHLSISYTFVKYFDYQAVYVKYNLYYPYVECQFSPLLNGDKHTYLSHRKVIKLKEIIYWKVLWKLKRYIPVLETVIINNFCLLTEVQVEFRNKCSPNCISTVIEEDIVFWITSLNPWYNLSGKWPNSPNQTLSSNL